MLVRILAGNFVIFGCISKISKFLKPYSSFSQTFVNMGPFPLKSRVTIESLGIELVHVLQSAKEKIDFENWVFIK